MIIQNIIFVLIDFKWMEQFWLVPQVKRVIGVLWYFMDSHLEIIIIKVIQWKNVIITYSAIPWGIWYCKFKVSIRQTSAVSVYISTWYSTYHKNLITRVCQKDREFSINTYTMDVWRGLILWFLPMAFQAEGVLSFPTYVRLSVRPSVCPSVR